jgi:multiple sugar transport system permease protein
VPRSRGAIGQWIAGDDDRGTALGFLTPLVLITLVLITLVLIVIPVLGTFWDSLFRDVTFLPRRFIGLGNYHVLWQDPAFWPSLRFTVCFVLVSVSLETLIGLGVALILHESFPSAGCYV